MPSYNDYNKKQKRYCLIYYVAKQFVDISPLLFRDDICLHSLFCLLRKNGFFSSWLEFEWVSEKLYNIYISTLFNDIINFSPNKNKELYEKVKGWSLSQHSIDAIIDFRNYYEKELKNRRAMEIIGVVAYFNSLSWCDPSDNDFVNYFLRHKKTSSYDGSDIGDFEIKLARKKLLNRKNGPKEKLKKPKIKKIEEQRVKNRWELMDL